LILLSVGLAVSAWYATTQSVFDVSKVSDLDKWILKEKEIALQGILSNIGPPAGVGEGIVVASPSDGEKEGEPDYLVGLLHDPSPNHNLFRLEIWILNIVLHLVGIIKLPKLIYLVYLD